MTRKHTTANMFYTMKNAIICDCLYVHLYLVQDYFKALPTRCFVWKSMEIQPILHHVPAVFYRGF